jgi:hypothetical protein
MGELGHSGEDQLGRYMFVAGNGMKKRRSVGNKGAGSSLNEFLQEEGVLDARVAGNDQEGARGD